MEQSFVTLFDGDEIPYNGGKIKVKVDHILDLLDDDEVYTGCYRATLENGQIINVEMGNDTFWIESGKGPSELASAIGDLIENYSE